jgi:hypothetical protein
MSLERSIELTCPECQHQQTAIIWDSLNADVSPEAREELPRGRINVFDCDGCGQKFAIPVPLLYHDMARKFLVQFYPFEAFDDAFLGRFDDNGRDIRFVDTCGAMNASEGDGGFSYMKNPHIVFDMGELVRYVLFRERLFDSRSRRAEIDRFFVAGFSHHHGPRLIDQLNVGDELQLTREPDNPHDPRAVAIDFHDDRIGYVPRERNRKIAELLDQGLNLTCRITAVDPEEGFFDAVEVSVAIPGGGTAATLPTSSPSNP